MGDNFNIDKNTNKEPQKNNKSFYSVNLTEGRIFVIFVLLVLVFVILFFGIFLLISKINKDNYARNSINSEATNSNTALNFYDASKSSDSSNDVKKEPNESNSEKKEDLVVEEKKNPEINLDNSEVLYSSKFKKVEDNNRSKNIKKEMVKTTTTTIKKNNTITKSTTKSTTNKKYVIQVGSYVNKETALEIENFYKSAGYPTYIQNYTKDGKTYYRLRIGPFKDKETANNYLISLKQSKYGKNSYISIINI